MENSLWSGVEAAIFDLDGTLADSIGVWSEIDTIFFRRHGMELPADYQENVKEMGFSRAAAYTKKSYGIGQSEEEIIREWHELAVKEYAERIELKAGVPRYLRELSARGVRIGLATASGPDLYEPFLRRCEILDFFQACVTTEEAGRDKAFPDVYLRCAQRLGVAPRGCVVFEDLLPAVRAAKSAGMRVVAVRDRQTPEDCALLAKEANILIRSFYGAPSLCRN